MNKAIKYLTTLKLNELRRRQVLCEKQMAIAFQSGNTVALENLQRMANDLFHAVDIVAFNN